ncbi:MAG TPA: TolC family protein [Candidatus Omnitrophota bacterium]|nr:TolC family protein [Candidatus Omnitrophota bacterium]
MAGNNHGVFEKRGMKFAGCFILSVVFTAVCTHSLHAEVPESLPQEQFGSLLGLNEAVARALTNQAEVKRAFARMKKEEALYKGSIAEFLPKLGGEIFQAVATGDRKSVTFLDAGIEQPLFKGGKILAGKRRRKVRLESEEVKLEEAKLEVELGVRVLYAETLKERELTRIAQGEVKELLPEHARIKQLVDKEVLPQHELFRMETILETAKHALVKHKETYDYLSGVLREIIGIGEGESLDLEPLSDFEEIEKSVSVYLETARKHDPVYRLSGLKVQEKNFEKKELQADRFPQLSLTTKWNRFRDVYADTNRAMVGIQGTWNIWDFGRLGNAIKAKSYEIEETKWAGEIEVREHEKEIQKFFHEARAAREKIRLAETLIRERREIFKNEKTKLIAGEKGSGELSDSFIALEEAKIQYLDAVTEYRILVVKLARKTGFGETRETALGETEERAQSKDEETGQ